MEGTPEQTPDDQEQGIDVFGDLEKDPEELKKQKKQLIKKMIT